jgi:hypothetical protein
LTSPYTVVGELQFTDVRWSLALNESGSFSGTINIADPRTLTNVGTAYAGYNSSLEYITQPGRVGLYVEYNNVPVWGGIIWTREWDAISQTLTVSAKTYDSWFEHRTVKDYKGDSGALVFDETNDQFEVMTGVNGVLDNVDSTLLVFKDGTTVSGDIGIDYDTSALSGVNLSGQYVVYDYEHKTVMQVLSDLYQQSTSEDVVTGQPIQLGFDWFVEVYYDTTGALRRTYRQYYPRKGNNDKTSASLPTLDFPGTALSYNWPEDGASMATVVHGIGPGSGDGVYTVQQTADVDYIVADYPVLEAVESFTQIGAVEVVDSLTQAKANALSVPLVTPSFTWNPGWAHTNDISVESTTGPALGEFDVGDLFRIRLLDPRFPNGAEYYLRLTRFEVSVGDNNNAHMVSGEFAFPTY